MPTKAKTVKTSTIRKNPNNPRIIKDKDFMRLVKSIQEFPEMMALRPIVTDEEGVVLGGNQRLAAIHHLGMEEIPADWVKKASELTEDQKREFMMKDNQNYGKWDPELIKKGDWDLSRITDWGIDVPMAKIRRDLKDDDFRMPEKVKTKIKTGDIFQVGRHRIICGNSLDPATYEALLEGKQIHTVTTDPPYNINYQGKTKTRDTIENDNMSEDAFYEFMLKALEVSTVNLVPGRAVYVFHADSQSHTVRRAFINSGLLLKQCLVWVKNSFVIGRQDYQWIHEPCLYGWKQGAAHYFTPDRTRATAWIEETPDFTKMKKDELVEALQEIYGTKLPKTALYYDRPSRNDLHPTMKPVPLIGETIYNSTKVNENVLDPFGGSGTTMVAAEMTDRNAYLIDMEPIFVQVTLDRMRKDFPEIEIKQIL